MFISEKKRKEKQVTSAQQEWLPINAKRRAPFVKNKSTREEDIVISPIRINLAAVCVSHGSYSAVVALTFLIM